MKSYILIVAFIATTFVTFGNNQKSNKTTNFAEQVSTETQHQHSDIDAVITYYLNTEFHIINWP